MNARVAKTHTRTSRVKLSKASLARLDAIVRESGGPSSLSRQQAAESGDLAWTAPPEYPNNNQINATLEIIPSPENNARVTHTNSREFIEGEKAEQVATPIQQPKPLPLKRPYTSFLKDFVDPPSTSPTPKRYRPESVNRFVTQWVESNSGLESYRGKHCRSDNILSHSGGDHITRRLTKSAPIMANRRDADGYAIPDTPASAGSRSNAQSVRPSASPSDTSGTGRSSKKKQLVSEPFYREINLALNNIFMRFYDEELPEHISNLVDLVGEDRDSPEPSAKDVRQNRNLQELLRGAQESLVQSYFQENIFPCPAGTSRDTLRRGVRMSMARHAVPDVGSSSKVSTPQPDLLYGYSRNAVSPQQQVLPASITNEMAATTNSLVYPFFVIEFKGDGPSGGAGLWVATNQCLGGSASCVTIAERLNDRLRQCNSSEITLIDSAAFSIAMSGSEARLSISWKHDDELKYYMQDIKTFAVQEPDQYIQFRKYVRNIFDWAKSRRLADIRDSLDALLEESARRASEVAKSRTSPADEDSASSSKRRA